MPAPPELGNRLTDIGMGKVFHKAKAHHQAQTNGHIRITGEVKIELRGIGQYR